MAEQVQAPAEAPPAVVQAAAPAPATAPAVDQTTDPKWLPQRLESAATAATSKLLGEMGFKSPDEAKAALGELKAMRESTLSEQEKARLRIAELEPAAAKAAALEQSLRGYADGAMATLTEAQRAAVKAIAGEDPALTLRTIEAMRQFAPAPATTTAPTVPASTSAAPAAPAPANGATSQIDHKARYSELRQKNPIEAARYFQVHGSAIMS